MAVLVFLAAPARARVVAANLGAIAHHRRHRRNSSPARGANVLATGDTVTIGRYPNIDYLNGGNIKGMIEASDAYLALANNDTKVVPGHGPLGDRAALATYRRVIATIRDRVGKLKASGKSLEEVQAAKPSAEFDAQWGGGFTNPEIFVGIVYNTVS